MHSLSFKEYYKLQIQKLSAVSGQDSSVQFYIEGRVGGKDRMVSADLMKALNAYPMLRHKIKAFL
jgi:hypothetical protein